CPAVEGMAVAVGTSQPDPHQRFAYQFSLESGVAGKPVEPGWPHLVRVANTLDQSSGGFDPRGVVADLLFEPGEHRLGGGAVPTRHPDAEPLGNPVTPEEDKLVGGEQRVDLRFSFAGSLVNNE